MMAISCTIETSDNGNLDGYWQLSSIDTLSSNGKTVNMRDSGIFWAVQKDLISTRSTHKPFMEILFKFKLSQDYLELNNPYILYRDASDIKVTDVSLLKRFGINSLDENFQILELKENTMILKSDILILYFRKY